MVRERLVAYTLAQRKQLIRRMFEAVMARRIDLDTVVDALAAGQTDAVLDGLRDDLVAELESASTNLAAAKQRVDTIRQEWA